MKDPAQQNGKEKLRMGTLYDVKRTVHPVEGGCWATIQKYPGD